jgi:hypothetical protein
VMIPDDIAKLAFLVYPHITKTALDQTIGRVWSGNWIYLNSHWSSSPKAVKLAIMS